MQAPWFHFSLSEKEQVSIDTSLHKPYRETRQLTCTVSEYISVTLTAPIMAPTILKLVPGRSMTGKADPCSPLPHRVLQQRRPDFVW